MKYIKYLIGIIVALIGGLFFMNRKREEAETAKKLAETKAKDQALAEQQVLVDAAIKDLDKGIEKMNAEREAEMRKRAEDNLTLQERADRLRQQTRERLKK